MDVEKTIQFIVEHQAKLTASAEKHDEQLSRLEGLSSKHEERISKLETSLATVTDLVGRLAQAEIRLVERMEAVELRMEKLFTQMERFLQGLEGNGHRPG